ncbi:MAG: oligopeptide transporter, OPT family [Candidatus Neomarinimicrobiota bacterium]|nr:oligopeptide transporter, OPT family [Candidatus Neomarinimicrobiota bacterium]
MKKEIHEITFKSIILGIILSMVLAGANAYLGLFAGMTVSASIPAAVISMGILSMFKKSNILENNIVQTAASAGESLAAGVIFTIPALLLMGYWESFNYFEVARIAAIGGIMGVLFTIPLRRALILEAKLKFPEGMATAEVLKTGEKARSNNATNNGLKILGLATLTGALMKLAQAGLSLWSSAIESIKNIGGAIFGIGCDLSPALLAVGYIVGRNISILVFSGGVLSWLIAIPVYSSINGHEGHIHDTAWMIWNTKIRYLGVGAMVVGGIWALIKLISPLIKGIKSSLNAISSMKNNDDIPNEEKDFSIKFVMIGLLILLLPVFFLYLEVIDNIFISIILSIVMLIFGFLFSSVASYMAGIVGSSNNPVSGVTIATILFSSLLLLAILGTGSTAGAASAIIIGAVVCCAAAIGGDNLQDLKTGHIVGATPWKQQVMQIIGTLSAAAVLGLVLDILHTAYVIGSVDFPAPQATLMKSVADGVFSGNLPWEMVQIGALIGIFIIILDSIQEKRKSTFRLPVLAIAVGIYLPIELSTPIFLGGMIAHYASRKKSNEKGLLFASGLITGEALMGIFVALPIFITGNKYWWPTMHGNQLLGVLLFILIGFTFYKTAQEK